MKFRCCHVCFIIITLSAVFGIHCSARAQENPVVSILKDADFSRLHTQIQTLVNLYGFHEINYFCMITYGSDGDKELAPIIYWPTQDKLIVWGIGADRLFDSNRYVNLSRDVLPNGVNTSPDYFTRHDVDTIVRDCERRGVKFKARKTQGGWVSIGKFKQFATVQAQLQTLVDDDGSSQKNRFCIIGQKDGSFLGAYIIWLNAGKLIFWLPDQYDQYEADALTDPTLIFDLHTGLRDREDSKDNRDEMQKSYAESVLHACSAMGQYFAVLKTK